MKRKIAVFLSLLCLNSATLFTPAVFADEGEFAIEPTASEKASAAAHQRVNEPANASPELAAERRESSETSAPQEKSSDSKTSSKAEAPSGASQGSLKPAAQQTRLAASANSTVLKGGITYRVPQGTSIKLKLASVPTNGMKLLDKDLEGNYLPAKVGQILTARTSEDIYVDDSKVIPEGTVFHGQVSEIAPPRRVGRPGSLSISFDEFTTPDGRTFAFSVDANTKRASTYKTKAHGTGIVAYHALGGAIVGTLVAYQVCGLHYTIATKGLNLAVGAAGGALIATGFALYRKGKKATLEPGDDLNMTIDTDLLMPAATEAVTKKEPNAREGIRIVLKKKPKLIKDGVGGWLLQVSCKIYNDSDVPLNSVDLFAEDTNGNKNPLSSGDNIDNAYLFTVEPQSMEEAELTFAIEYPKLKQQLIWLDRHSRQICYRQKLD